MKDTSHALSVQLAVKTPEIRKTLTRILQGIDAVVLQNDPDAEKVDVLVLEIGSNPVTEFETISMLLKENVVGTLFLTSSKTTTDVLLPALRAGAKEFFPQPINANDVIEAFNKVMSDSLVNNNNGDSKAPRSKIYSVVGVKGGVGTTTFAVNLATSMKAAVPDKSVVLIDMNRLFGEVCLFLDIDQETNWEEIGRNISRLDAKYLQSAMTKHSSGVFVLPAPGKVNVSNQLPYGSLFKILKGIRRFFDYIVIDCGMDLREDSMKIFAESEAVYLISTLCLPCMINVRKIQKSLAAPNSSINGKVQIIANRFEKKSQYNLRDAQEIIGTEIKMTIPNNYPLSMTAINNGKPVSEVSKKSDMAVAYKKLAESLVDMPEKDKGMFARLFN